MFFFNFQILPGVCKMIVIENALNEMLKMNVVTDDVRIKEG